MKLPYLHCKLTHFSTTVSFKGKLINNPLTFTTLTKFQEHVVPLNREVKRTNLYLFVSSDNFLLHFLHHPFLCLLGLFTSSLTPSRNCKMRLIAIAPSCRSSTRRVPASSSSAPAREQLRSDSNLMMITNASTSWLQGPRTSSTDSVLL